MKGENNYSLKIEDNYKKTIDCSIGEVTKKYGDLIICYSKFINENIKLKNGPLSQFIIIRGLDTLTNVFLYLLNATKNIELTYFHCEKSFYFYTEFVDQITDDEKTFLKLTTRDAVNYVYKKTIYDINKNFKKQDKENSDDFTKEMKIIKSYVNLYQSYLLKTDKLNEQEINYLRVLFYKLNNITDKTEIFVLENITDKLFHKIEEKTKFYEFSILIVEKFVKNPKILKNVIVNMNSPEFNNILENTPGKLLLSKI